MAATDPDRKDPASPAIRALAAVSEAASRAFTERTPEAFAAWQDANAAYRAAYAGLPTSQDNPSPASKDPSP